MDKLIEILMDIDDSVDYETETALVDDHILDSFGIITLVSEIEEEFGVNIVTADMVPENFNSAQAIWNLIQKKSA
jgi:acyl carrier protein